MALPIGGPQFPHVIMHHQPQWVGLAPGAVQIIHAAGDACNITNNFNDAVQVDVAPRFLPEGRIHLCFQMGDALLILPIRDEAGAFFHNLTIIQDAGDPNRFDVRYN